MATFSYNTVLTNVPEIYRATSGGTVFSANLGTSTNFDYFTDTAVVNDAIYFANGANSPVQSDFTFNVGTALVGVDVVLKWEYYRRGVGWIEMEHIIDDTNGFTVTGQNRVRFPIQWSRDTRTINGINRMWTRVRIQSLTSISEGGANVTNRVQSSDGRVVIDGGTDSVPTSFTELVTLCNANIPHIPVIKYPNNTFDLTKIAFRFTGRCVTRGEVILVGSNGPSSQGAGQNHLNYITSGIKYGDRGIRGSVFVVYGSANSGVLDSGSDTKLYGTVIKTGKEQTDANAYYGYHSLVGENIDCFFESSSFLVNSNVTNSRICNGIIISGGSPTLYTNNTYICLSDIIFYCYTVSFTVTGFSYQFIPTSAFLFYAYQSSGYINQKWTLINPGTPIGLVTDAIKPIRISEQAPSDLLACKFYNSTTGTYTNYLTEASNTTADDVPLTGEVGDYYLFGVTTANQANGFCLDMTITNQENDYEYAWEVYTTSGWVAINPNYLWDTSFNFTKSGRLYTGASYVTTTVTIDTVSGRWIRARITKKGTTTPKASRIRQGNYSFVSGWSIKEQWTVDLKVVDNNGDSIDGATVAAATGFDSFTTTTNSSGVIAQQILTAKEFHFDPINNPTTFISQNLYPTFNLTISKSGYETYTATGVTLDKAVNTVIALKPVKKIRQTVDGKTLFALKAERGSSAKLLEI